MADRLEILQHALGLDGYGRRTRGTFRNGFVTNAGGDDHVVCTELVEAGLMERRPCNRELTGGGDFFSVTRAGERYVAENSPKPPKLTRSQSRYQAWLDADCGMKFGEWLRCSPEPRA